MTAVYAQGRVVAYAFGLAKNHGFVDGNKRTAWVVSRLFLADNAYRLVFDAADSVRIMERVAAGSMDETQLASWFRARISPERTGRSES